MAEHYVVNWHPDQGRVPAVAIAFNEPQEEAPPTDPVKPAKELLQRWSHVVRWHNQADHHAQHKGNRKEQTGRVTHRRNRKCAFHRLFLSSLRRVASRLRFELVQALFGAETDLLPLKVLGITLAGIDWHSADRIFDGPFALPVITLMLVATMTPMNHVCPASETHHQVEKRCEQQKRQ